MPTKFEWHTNRSAHFSLPSWKIPVRDTNTPDFSASFFLPFLSPQPLYVSACTLLAFISALHTHISLPHFAFPPAKDRATTNYISYIFNSSRRNADFDILSIKTHKLSSRFRSSGAQPIISQQLGEYRSCHLQAADPRKARAKSK